MKPEEYKNCPFCFEQIKKSAIKCRYCGEHLNNIKTDENEGSYKYKLSVVIPVYNEKETIESILELVASVPLNKELIIVDDYSTDGTRNILEKIEKYWNKNNTDNNKATFLYQAQNMGKGAALRTGFKHTSGDIVIIQDADHEYNPQEYHRLIRPILNGKADVVYGSRFIGETHRVLYFWHYIGNKFLTLLSNFFTDLNLTDMESCYKVFKKEIVEKLDLEENRFGIEPEMTAKVAKMGCRIYEVPISYSGRDYSEGKKIGWKDGIRAIYSIIKYNLFR